MLCGLSVTDLQLVFFRALQGFGAAFIAANSPAIVTDTFPREERGKALGINTMAVYTGLTVGPVLGGCPGSELWLEVDLLRERPDWDRGGRLNHPQTEREYA